MKRKTLCRLCAAALCLVIGCTLFAACAAPGADDFVQPKWSSASRATRRPTTPTRSLQASQTL